VQLTPEQTAEPESTSTKKMARVASFIGGVAVHVAASGQRLVVNHSAPE
jgi:hypothetical protein